MDKAVYVAINEKARYVSERIARTEAAKAWADGFYSQALQNPNVVGFRWKTGSRHPVFDICNVYANADMFNMGKGVYPKDKVPPLHAHPHCLCRLHEVYKTEVDLSKVKDNTDKEISEWVKGLNDRQRQDVLGVKGAKEFSETGKWQGNLRGWQGLGVPESRLRKNIKMPADTLANSVVPSDIKNEIERVLNDIESKYDVKIDEIIYKDISSQGKIPMQFNPQNDGGLFKSQFIINNGYDWNATLDEFNERIYNKNYKKGLLASKNLEGLVHHEAAHFMTFQDCKTWNEFIKKEQDVMREFKAGLSLYNNSLKDGAESIAEAFVNTADGEAIPSEFEALLSKYIKRWEK